MHSKKFPRVLHRIQSIQPGIKYATDIILAGSIEREPYLRYLFERLPEAVTTEDYKFLLSSLSFLAR